MACVWVLTDSRYLQQRMPLGLMDALSERGVPMRPVVADQHVASIGPAGGECSEGPWAELRAGDVVVPRTRHPLGLFLLQEAERRGAKVVNSSDAIKAVRNKPGAFRALAASSVPLPETWLASGPAALQALPREFFPLILKPYLGDNARGIVVVSEPVELLELDWNDPIVVAQRFVPNTGVDLKLYAVGEHVWAVRRPSPLSGSLEAHAPLVATPALRDLTLCCGRAFGLGLYGVDVVESASGPLVVDVNDFPNYTGLADPVGVIVDLLAALATGVAR